MQSLQKKIYDNEIYFLQLYIKQKMISTTVSVSTFRPYRNELRVKRDYMQKYNFKKIENNWDDIVHHSLAIW